jgi:hypothetical protein
MDELTAGIHAICRVIRGVEHAPQEVADVPMGLARQG